MNKNHSLNGILLLGVYAQVEVKRKIVNALIKQMGMKTIVKSLVVEISVVVERPVRRRVRLRKAHR